MKTFFDKYGILHHRPVIDGDPETSENGPMFTGAYYVGRKINSDSQVKIRSILNRLSDSKGSWITTPVSSVEAGFSHDNFKGVMAIISCLHGMDQVKYKPRLPLLHRQMAHPRDFILMGYFKYPWLFWPLLPIPWVALLISCYQTYKVRNNRKIIKTDGKILAHMICKTFKWEWLERLCLKLVTRERKEIGKYFKSWGDVYREYFREEGHPLREIE